MRLFTFFLFLLFASLGNSAVLVVRSTHDSGPGSLRQAVDDARNGDTIMVPVTGQINFSRQIVITNSVKIYGPGARLLTLSGSQISRIFVNTASNVVIGYFNFANGSRGIVEPDPDNGTFYEEREEAAAVLNHGHLTIVDSEFQNNEAVVGAALSSHANAARPAFLRLVRCFIHDNRALGGAAVYATGYLTIENSTISNNRARKSPDHPTRGGGNAGGVAMGSIIAGSTILPQPHWPGKLFMTNTTISGNTAVGFGGGFAGALGEYYFDHCTIAFNSATNGGGIANAFMAGKYVLRNTIVAKNSIPTGAGTGSTDLLSLIFGSGTDLLGTFHSEGFNLIENPAGYVLIGTGLNDIQGEDPLMEKLEANGGATWTHALGATSPAIDAGLANYLLTDQRGSFRPEDQPSILNVMTGDGGDIGAFESQLDSDSDGMADTFEKMHGLNRNANDSQADSDSDGATNFHEYQAGTNPKSSASVFKIKSISQEETGIRISMTGAPGRPFRLEGSADLASWEELPYVFDSAESNVEYVESNLSSPCRYFRLKSLF